MVSLTDIPRQRTESYMIKSILVASVLSLAALSTASATPVVALPQLPSLAAPPVMQIQYGGDRRMNRDRRDRHPRRRWVPGHRYDRAPPHWHRYHRRPHDWLRRGCIIVGPFWFCP